MRVAGEGDSLGRSAGSDEDVGGEVPGVVGGFDDADIPAGLGVAAAPAGFGAEGIAGAGTGDHDGGEGVVGVAAEGELAEVEFAEEVDLLVGADGERAVEPEIGDVKGFGEAAVVHLPEVVAVAIGSDAAGDDPVAPDAGDAEGALEGLVAVVIGEFVADAVPGEGGVFVLDGALFEADQGVGDLEGGSGDEALAGAGGVVDECLVGLEGGQDDGSGQTALGEGGGEGRVLCRKCEGGDEEEERKQAHRGRFHCSIREGAEAGGIAWAD